jgi:hypothetical protein
LASVELPGPTCITLYLCRRRHARVERRYMITSPQLRAHSIL